MKTELTKSQPVAYNGTEPVKCECGRVIAFQLPQGRYRKCSLGDGGIFLKCPKCKRIIAIRAESF